MLKHDRSYLRVDSKQSIRVIIKCRTVLTGKVNAIYVSIFLTQLTWVS